MSKKKPKSGVAGIWVHKDSSGWYAALDDEPCWNGGFNTRKEAVDNVVTGLIDSTKRFRAIKKALEP